MGHSQPAQQLSGVRTWVTDSRENTPSPSPSRPDYADGQPKRDRVLPLPSDHPKGRDEQRAGPPVFNGPSDSSGASTSYSKAPNPNAKPNQKPLHQRPRSSGLPGDQYGHPYIDQSTSTGLKRRVAQTDDLIDEILSDYLEDEDFYYDIDEGGNLIKVSAISVSVPRKRQRKQKGEAKREYKKRRIRLRLRNKTKLKTKRRRYYLRNKSRIKRYNQKRRNNPNRFKRYEGGGASTIRQKNQRARKAQLERISSMTWYDVDHEGNLVLKASEEMDLIASEEMDLTAEELQAYKKRTQGQKNQAQKARNRGSKNRPDRVKRRKRDKKNKAKIKRQQKRWRTKNKNRLASSDPKLQILQALLSVLRAAHWSHWTSHWQAQGEASYSDHQLMERLYEGIEDEIDTLAEKIVGEYGPVAVAPVPQAQQTIQSLLYHDHHDPIIRALKVEENIQPILSKVYDQVKSLGGMSLGLDDYIMSIASAHETNIYLLRQRTQG